MQTIEIDPIHPTLTEFEMPLIDDVWGNKYKWTTDADMNDTVNRVVGGIYAKDPSGEAQQLMRYLMLAGLWMPGGRILAGAGTSKIVTLMNCYVNETLSDSMSGIHRAIGNTMFTLQQGGGIGTDFSPLRPSGASLKRTGPGSAASGPLPFMKQWDATSQTIKSAGDRRGAMMGTISDTHPDLPAFIVAKQNTGDLKQFNMSVLVSDAFMEAVEADAMWALHFPHEPSEARPPEIANQDFIEDGVHQYVYSVWKARELWDMIMEGTYVHAEPGVIFIDRVNDLNNLSYCETIRCTNPCVTGDTEILTDAGYKPIDELIGQHVNIWNGETWSEVVPFETGLQDLMSVTFSNGQRLKVTPDHKFFVGGEFVKAMDLKAGDKLDWASMPILELPHTGLKVAGYNYTQGFFAGDGCEGSEHSKLYAPKYTCRNRLEGTFGDERIDRGTYVNWYHGLRKLRDDVPVHASIAECIDWLAGWLDADGTVSKKNASYVLEGSSANKAFLNEVVLMLTRLGCNPRMWAGKDGGVKTVNGVEGAFRNTYRLMLNMADTWQLKSLGLKCERLDLGKFHKPKGIAKVGQRVVSVSDLPDPGFTYCFTESQHARGVFNGVSASQCGEQPLPPNGTCNLGAVNLSRLVRDPFTPDARVDWDLLHTVVVAGIRFLDNVIDVTQYPLEAQKEEEENKRRLGLGISGLADCLAQLGVVYGSPDSEERVEEIMKAIAVAAYESSAMLAQERGAFPLYDEAILEAPFIKKLPEELQATIADLGLRNGVLLTIAPTGTTSLVYGNISSGLEPNFAFSYNRQVFSSNNAHNAVKYEEVTTYLWRLYKKHLANMYGDNTAFDPDNLPNYMVTAQKLGVTAHLRIQAACQKWVDASISKTINVPTHCSFEHFKAIYMEAYAMGCKGCTTYRPNDESDIGSVLEVASSEAAEGDDAEVSVAEIRERPDFLQGLTYKIKWPSWNASIFVTINHDEEGVPFEIFLQSKDARHQEWITALTIMMSGHMRRGDYLWIPEELKAIHSVGDTAWVAGKFYGSVLARIGEVIDQHFKRMGVGVDLAELPPGTYQAKFTDVKVDEDTGKVDVKFEVQGERCPSCSAPAYIHSDGCGKCTSCGHSSCG